MEYAITNYQTNSKNSCRYTLGNPADNPLVVMGLNPSTADDQKPDMTIKKVMGFAEQNGFDSFLMINLYPQRTPYPEKLHKRKQLKLLDENLSMVRSNLEGIPNPSILAAWGNQIGIRPYLLSSLEKLCDSLPGASWLRIGSLTRGGHPRHPSRTAYKQPLLPFDVRHYVEELRK